jgi:hypothetical protein
VGAKAVNNRECDLHIHQIVKINSNFVISGPNSVAEWLALLRILDIPVKNLVPETGILIL